jgi:hypothetical protein
MLWLMVFISAIYIFLRHLKFYVVYLTFLTLLDKLVVIAVMLFYRTPIIIIIFIFIFIFIFYSYPIVLLTI